MTEMSAPGSKRKRLSRVALLWALLAAVVLVAGFVLLDRDDYEQADLSFVTGQIQEHKVSSATIKDAEQRVEITTTDGRRFHAEWDDSGRARELNDILQEAQPVDGYTMEVPSSNRFFLGPLEIFAAVVLLAVLVVFLRRARRLGKDH
ncbi:hypothetical protein Psi02_10110 [Planotetraspora silvatica]|uniref:Uncharacterized protein n=1 Tax=Planotetraspora silvatica TaxID=234614 RepID=A0A8J3XJU1_9ACTN|nr:hypothetical protein [Planotetraspora silvatica]GII44587.1 hypothetical protein Psi02_10110 [Planotetraspora silvatica]